VSADDAPVMHGVGDVFDNGRRTLSDEEARAQWAAIAAIVRALPPVRYSDIVPRYGHEDWAPLGRCVP
jgi:hypothetical protein